MSNPELMRGVKHYESAQNLNGELAIKPGNPIVHTRACEGSASQREVIYADGPIDLINLAHWLENNRPHLFQSDS